MPTLQEITRYCDEYLRIADVPDWDNALNGLQLENSGNVTKLGAAVDASSRTLMLAAQSGVSLLLVHHGLFWRGAQPVTGAFARQLKEAFRHDVAIYSAHLPLDVHPLVGNNAQLATALGLENPEPFLPLKGTPSGVKAAARIARHELAARLQNSLGNATVKLIPGGPAETAVIGIVTGGAGGEIYDVAREGVDTFITGEAPHWAGVAAEELGVNLFLGGHYATETFGVKALAAHLAERFGLPWEFLSAPTGL